jgi:EpsI family protein
MVNMAELMSSFPKVAFLAAGLLLAIQAVGIHQLSLPERELPLPPLQQLPVQIGGWGLSDEQTLEPSVLQALKPDGYVLRDYVDPGRGNPVNLFVAYFKSLQNAYGPHSPRVCLPGSGWLVHSLRIRPLIVPGHADGIPVNEYVLEKNHDRILVLYWYQNNRNVWAEEFRAKLTMLPDLIRYRRSDVSLVRLVTPLQSEDGKQELTRCQEFARMIFPSLVEDLRNGD